MKRKVDPFSLIAVLVLAGLLFWLVIAIAPIGWMLP
jgi:hypothetical protein